MKKKSILKATSLLFILLVSFYSKASATIFTVEVANFSFTPANITNVVIGDTIRWHFVAGSFDHTTTCNPALPQALASFLPAGAPTWDAPLDDTDTTFDYVASVAGAYHYVCKPHRNFMFADFTVSAPLPVKLSEFKVTNESNNAVLRWTTQSEDNIDYFSVQKSKTGSDFVEIGKVPAAGNSSTLKTYSFTDPNPASSDKYGYYTIAIVDKEGKREFSPVGLFKNKINISKVIISLSPNPVSRSGHLMLKFNADRTSKMEVRLISTEGKTVLQSSMQAFEGVNNGHLMLEGISAGSYSAIFELNGVKEVYKLIVR